MKDLINTKEAAAILGVSPETIKKWRERKLFGIPFFVADEMHGDTWYYERERVEQLKSVYQKGVLQNMYKLANAFDKLPSPDFQKSGTTLGLFSSGFYSTETVAKILGIDEKTLRNWRDKKIFVEDYQTHVGISLYSQDRVLEMKLFCGKNTGIPHHDAISSFNEFLNLAEGRKKSILLHPIKKRLVPNFKLCKVIYDLEQEKYGRMVVDGKRRRIVEKKNHKKFGDLFTVYKISNAHDYDNSDPLNEFDYAVYSVCVSYFDAGYKCITPAIIYRALTGKNKNFKLTPDLREAILNSLKKLIGTIIEIDETNVNAAFKYADVNKSKHISAILPAHFDDKIINGNDASVVYFDRISPLMEIAHNRKQLLTYEISLLDAPGIRNTFMNIMLKSYVMRRVTEIKLHKKLRPILTFADIFKKCRIEDKSRKTKMDARETIIKLFEHLQAEGFIKSFELTKEANAFYSIKFIH